MDKKIGFIGLGTMGKPMAMNLLKAGYRIVCFDINKQAVREMAAAGASEGASCEDIALSADVIITILPADKHIMDVYASKNGLLDSAKDGTVFIEMTSARGGTVKEIARLAQEKGKKVTIIDAPVSGGVPAAQAGTLTIMAGGDKSAVEEYRPLLEKMGSKIFYTGDVGSGKSIKMINQLLNAGNTCVMSEAIFLAREMGLDMDLMCNVVNESSGGSWVFRNNAPKFVLPGKFDQGFRLELMKKDLGLSVEQAEADHISLPLTSLVYKIYEAMSEEGFDKSNYNVVSRWIYRQNNKEEV